MFIDYVTLMLINMAAGLVVLACFLWTDIEKPDRQRWAPAFAVPGVIAAVCGFAMTFSWPLPSPYNITFGETSVLLGLLFLAASWALARGWNLRPLGLYALPAGATAILMGVRIIDLGLTANPTLSGIGFILTGLAGVGALPTLYFSENVWLRRFGSVIVLAAALIWLWTGFHGYWAHVKPAA